MPDSSRHNSSNTDCSKCDQIDRIADLCDQLNRTLRGYNGQVGLITQVALLVDQSQRIGADLEGHIREHQEDRAKQRTSHMQILERVILWLLIAVLTLVTAEGKLANLKEIAPLVQDKEAGR